MMKKVQIAPERNICFSDLRSRSGKLLELKPASVGFSLLKDSAQLAGAFVPNSIRLPTKGVRSTHETIISQVVDRIVSGSAPPGSAEEGCEAVRVLNMVVEDMNGKLTVESA